MRTLFLLGLSLALTAPATARGAICTGVFIHDSCMLGGDGKDCYYPQRKGTEQDFVSRLVTDGVPSLSVYRLGPFRAADIRLDNPRCKLPSY